MNKIALAMLLSLAPSLTGCASRADQQVTTPSPQQRQRLATAPDELRSERLESTHAAARDEVQRTLGNAFGAAPRAPTPAPCLRDAPKEHYGFYRTDSFEQGSVVLTFDDGPHPNATPRVLDLLEKHKLPATFFLVGRAISRETFGLVQRMVREGHTLGSHSYSHDVKMTRLAAPETSIEDIRGQHETTSMLIDIALLAESGDDFDAMFRQVFQKDPAVWLAASGIRKEWRNFKERHQRLLAERGLAAGERPYTVIYSRPPGGGPYVEHDGRAGIEIHDAALRELGMMNVLWNGASGDTDPAQRGDFGFLSANLERYSKKGGVLLIHDYIRPDALAQGLAKMVEDPQVHPIRIEQALQQKYGCTDASMHALLAHHGLAPREPALAEASRSPERDVLGLPRGLGLAPNPGGS